MENKKRKKIKVLTICCWILLLAAAIALIISVANSGNLMLFGLLFFGAGLLRECEGWKKKPVLSTVFIGILHPCC